MKFSSVLFDFDYTLADSSRGTAECVNFALGRLGLPPASTDAVSRTIGLSLPDTLAALAGPEHTAQSAAFAHHFIERADQVMTALTVMYDTVRPAVRLLRQHGKKLGIVSTKFRYRIEGILERDGLLDAFDVIVGGEDVARHKPDPEGLCQAVERLGNPPEQALYVGDSVVDAEAAERGGIAFAAVLTGATRREAFAGYPALGIVEDLRCLTEWLVGNPDLPTRPGVAGFETGS